jgi:hypothetical protein
MGHLYGSSYKVLMHMEYYNEKKHNTYITKKINVNQRRNTPVFTSSC